jgi:hypothetical protein
VPSISVWRVSSLAEGSNGTYDIYLHAIHQISEIYPLYDFSIPSAVTSRAENTYDGSHYNLKTNAKIANILNGEPMTFGVRVDTLSEEEYKKRYKQAVKIFANSSAAKNAGSAKGRQVRSDDL